MFHYVIIMSFVDLIIALMSKHSFERVVSWPRICTQAFHPAFVIFPETISRRKENLHQFTSFSINDIASHCRLLVELAVLNKLFLIIIVRSPGLKFHSNIFLPSFLRQVTYSQLSFKHFLVAENDLQQDDTDSKGNFGACFRNRVNLKPWCEKLRVCFGNHKGLATVGHRLRSCFWRHVRDVANFDGKKVLYNENLHQFTNFLVILAM